MSGRSLNPNLGSQPPLIFHPIRSFNQLGAPIGSSFGKKGVGVHGGVGQKNQRRKTLVVFTEPCTNMQGFAKCFRRDFNHWTISLKRASEMIGFVNSFL